MTETTAGETIATETTDIVTTATTTTVTIEITEEIETTDTNEKIIRTAGTKREIEVAVMTHMRRSIRGTTTENVGICMSWRRTYLPFTEETTSHHQA